MAAHRPSTEKRRPSSNPRNLGNVDGGARTYEQRLRDRRPEPNQPPSELPEKPKAQESRSTLRRLLEAFIAVVMEESVRSFIPALLPYAWAVILAGVTWEILHVPRVEARWRPLF